ncbi:hypothetical protein Droror1_Dr00020501 [Drosera rotundifolia]
MITQWDALIRVFLKGCPEKEIEGLKCQRDLAQSQVDKLLPKMQEGKKIYLILTRPAFVPFIMPYYVSAYLDLNLLLICSENHLDKL